MPKHDWKRKEKERAVLENGAKLLEERIRTCFGRDNPIKVFSANQVQQAVYNYRERHLHQTCPPSDSIENEWCKGILDDRLVLIRQNEVKVREEFVFRDIVVSSMMSSHRNVLKLLGCCLEMSVPALVYEDAEKGALNSRGGQDEDGSLPWRNRLKIAKEIASAVAYMHTAFPTPIIHRNIKPMNIFLDQHYAAKLSDFSFSISIPDGETSVEDLVSGTFGFVDPAYFNSSLITDKTDVYSFGILLLIFLTGKPPVEDYGHLSERIASLVQEGRFNEVVDPAIPGNVAGIDPELREQLLAFHELAWSCINAIPEDRPSMTQVAKELLRIERSVASP